MTTSQIWAPELGVLGTGRMGSRLAEGDYVVVQVPDKLRVTWRWDEWRYDPTSMPSLK